jgi:hypothetical protein
MPATRTDLLERYLHAVKFWLPKAQQKDIIAELAEDLQSQIEERGAELGHALGEDEIARLLKRRGSPMSVASGYLPDQSLIQPAMLPIYRLVLKIVLVWVLAPLFAVVFIGAMFLSRHPGEVMLRAWAEAWQAGFMAVGIITTVFALVNRAQIRVNGLDKWDPRSLPRVPPAQAASMRCNHLGGFIFGLLAAAFWVYLMWQRMEFAFADGPRIVLGPVWERIYWPVLGVTLVSASIDLVSFMYPAWARVRSRIRIGIDVVALAGVAALLQVSDWVEIVGTNLSAADSAKTMASINVSAQITLISIAVVLVIDALIEARRLMRDSLCKPAPVLTA